VDDPGPPASLKLLASLTPATIGQPTASANLHTRLSSADVSHGDFTNTCRSLSHRCHDNIQRDDVQPSESLKCPEDLMWFT